MTSPIPIHKNTSSENAWKYPDVFLISRMHQMQICRPNSLEVTEVIAAQPSEYMPKLPHKTGLKSESPVTIRKLCIVINNCGKPAAFQFTCFALPNMAAKSIRFSGPIYAVSMYILYMAHCGRHWSFNVNSWAVTSYTFTTQVKKALTFYIYFILHHIILLTIQFNKNLWGYSTT